MPAQDQKQTSSRRVSPGKRHNRRVDFGTGELTGYATCRDLVPKCAAWTSRTDGINGITWCWLHCGDALTLQKFKVCKQSSALLRESAYHLGGAARCLKQVRA